MYVNIDYLFYPLKENEISLVTSESVGASHADSIAVLGTGIWTPHLL